MEFLVRVLLKELSKEAKDEVQKKEANLTGVNKKPFDLNKELIELYESQKAEEDAKKVVEEAKKVEGTTGEAAHEHTEYTEAADPNFTIQQQDGSSMVDYPNSVITCLPSDRAEFRLLVTWKLTRGCHSALFGPYSWVYIFVHVKVFSQMFSVPVSRYENEFHIFIILTQFVGSKACDFSDLPLSADRLKALVWLDLFLLKVRIMTLLGGYGIELEVEPPSRVEIETPVDHGSDDSQDDSRSDNLESYNLARDRTRREVKTPDTYRHVDLIAVAFHVSSQIVHEEHTNYAKLQKSKDRKKWNGAMLEEMHSLKNN
uniref:Uncharacterized protein n=1 Tax=Cannabis sativa TaxID=3483 RepID=A0A803PR67_CANSA